MCVCVCARTHQKMYHEKNTDNCGLQFALGVPSSGPILTVLPTLPRSRRTHRFHPFSQQQPLLYRPHLNLPSKQRSPSPPQVGTHISRLYPEILALIFSYLDIKDKGVAAQVCSLWKEASYNKSVWRGVEARLHLRRPNPALVNSLTRRGIKRIQILSLRKSFREISQGIGHLTSLNLSGCYNVRDENLSQAFSQPIPTLLHLDLSLCKAITDKSVLHIAQSMPNLESLDLGGCLIMTDEGLKAISGGLRRLKSLNLRSCWNISDQGIRLMAGQSEKSAGNVELQRLGLQDCPLLSDDALKYISQGLTQVDYINLSFCGNISDVGLKYLAKMTTLREVDLNSCDNVTDAGLAFMAEAASPITTLDISFCLKVTDQSLDYISQGLFNLRCLSLTQCEVSDEGVCKMAKALSDVEVLDISQCKGVTERSLYAITESFRNLRWVDLYGCTNVAAEAIADVKARVSPRCVLSLTISKVKKS